MSNTIPKNGVRVSETLMTRAKTMAEFSDRAGKRDCSRLRPD